MKCTVWEIFNYYNAASLHSVLYGDGQILLRLITETRQMHDNKKET